MTMVDATGDGEKKLLVGSDDFEVGTDNYCLLCFPFQGPSANIYDRSYCVAR